MSRRGTSCQTVRVTSTNRLYFHERESVLLLDGAPACKPYTVLNTYECDDPNRDPELVEQELVFRQKFLVGDGRPFLDAPGNFSVSMSLSAAEVFGEDVLSAITIANSARFDGAGRDDHFKPIMHLR